MEIIKKSDAFSVRSADFLKTLLAKQIKNVFTKSLRCIEMRFGKDFEGYDSIRKEILRSGNDAIREMERIIDERFNVEHIPDMIVVRFEDRKGK